MLSDAPSASGCSTNKRGVDFGGQAGVAGMALCLAAKAGGVIYQLILPKLRR
jgi:hypothetical protein